MQFIKSLTKSKFLQQNAVFFIGALLVSVLNYLYYPVLGRLLSLSEYGEVQVLVSLYLQLTIFLTAMGQVAVNIIANTDDPRKRDKLIIELQKFAFLLLIALLLVGTALSWWISSLFQLASPLPFVVSLAGLLAAIPITFQTAYLRGTQRFGAASVAGVITAAGRVLFSALFVLLGWSTAGAIGGIIASQLIGAFYAYKVVKRHITLAPTEKPLWTLPDMRQLWPELRFASFVLVASLGVTVLSSIDTIVVKAFFDPETAGGYAGVSTAAKIIFFLTGSIAQVMLPAVKMHAAPRDNRILLLKSFVLLVAAGGSALAFFALFPEFVIITLMGNTFAPYAHILPILSAAMFAISIVNLVVNYYIAQRRFQVAFVVAIGTACTILLLITQHTTPLSIAVNLLYGSLAMLTLFVIWRVGYELYHRRKSS